MPTIIIPTDDDGTTETVGTETSSDTKNENSENMSVDESVSNDYSGTMHHREEIVTRCHKTYTDADGRRLRVVSNSTKDRALSANGGQTCVETCRETTFMYNGSETSKKKGEPYQDAC